MDFKLFYYLKKNFSGIPKYIKLIKPPNLNTQGGLIILKPRDFSHLFSSDSWESQWFIAWCEHGVSGTPKVTSRSRAQQPLMSSLLLFPSPNGSTTRLTDSLAYIFTQIHSLVRTLTHTQTPELSLSHTLPNLLEISKQPLPRN